MEVDELPQKPDAPETTQQGSIETSNPSSSNSMHEPSTSNSSIDNNKNDHSSSTNGNDNDLQIVVDDDKQQEKQGDEPVDVEGGNADKLPVSKLDQWINWLQEGIPLTGEQLEKMCITMDDFKEALKKVQPSAKREGFATVPDVTWNNIGSLDGVKEELKTSLLVS